MKKLSVIAMVAMTALASTSCISFDEDEIPGTPEEYGYIKLSASADDVMVTRGEQNVGKEEIANWFAWVLQGDGDSDYKYGDATAKKKIGDGLESQPFAVGSYKVVVSNFAKEDDWKTSKNGFGEAYYVSEETSVTVTVGTQATADAKCGKAKNAKFKINSSGFSGSKLEVNVTSPREVTFSTENSTIGNDAFFDAGATLQFEIKYTIGEKEKTLSDKSLELAGAATVNTLTISSDENGTIKVTITYDDTFDTGKNEEIEIDSATGEEKPKSEKP